MKHPFLRIVEPSHDANYVVDPVLHHADGRSWRPMAMAMARLDTETEVVFRWWVEGDSITATRRFQGAPERRPHRSRFIGAEVIGDLEVAINPYHHIPRNPADRMRIGDSGLEADVAAVRQLHRAVYHLIADESSSHV